MSAIIEGDRFFRGLFSTRTLFSTVIIYVPSNRILIEVLNVIRVMSYSAIIGGHSQVPRHLPNLSNTTITTVKVNGAKLKHFWDHPKFDCLRKDEHDLAIVFLGGNYVYDGCVLKKIVGNIIDITNHLQ